MMSKTTTPVHMIAVRNRTEFLMVGDRVTPIRLSGGSPFLYRDTGVIRALFDTQEVALDGDVINGSIAYIDIDPSGDTIPIALYDMEIELLTAVGEKRTWFDLAKAYVLQETKHEQH